MPIYEYACPACKRRVEVFQRERKDDGERSPACPECGARRLRPLISRFAFSSEEDWAGFDGVEDLDSDDPEAVKAWADDLAEQTGQPYPPGFTDALLGDDDVD